MAAGFCVLSLSWCLLLRGEGRQSLGVDLEGTQRAMLPLESADGTVSGQGVITGDHLVFCKLKRAQATSSTEGEINKANLQYPNESSAGKTPLVGLAESLSGESNGGLGLEEKNWA